MTNEEAIYYLKNAAFIGTEKDIDNIEAAIETLEEQVLAEESNKNRIIADKIGLLSVEEYTKYKDLIPNINMQYWLENAGYGSIYNTYVERDGSVYILGHHIHNINAVRPAIYIKNCMFKTGSHIIRYGFPWVVLGDNLAIAEVPIAFKRFDGISNVYKDSEIRKFLLEWLEERKYK